MLPVFLDTEFTSLTDQAELLSIALVTVDGAAFYGVFDDARSDTKSAFVCETVIPLLDSPPKMKEGMLTRIHGNRAEIAAALVDWLEKLNDHVQIWADVLTFDWTLFCKLLGGTLNLPQCVHYIPMELATLLWLKGVDPDIKRLSLIAPHELPHGFAPHNALSDTLLSMLIFKKYTLR